MGHMAKILRIEADPAFIRDDLKLHRFTATIADIRHSVHKELLKGGGVLADGILLLERS